MKKETKGMTAILLVYSLLMLSIMGITVFILSQRMTTALPQLPNDSKVEEKTVYVYVEKDEEITTSTTTEEIWIVKEHDRRIGIFSEDGQLLELLEIYTNTLPKADQGLLREGISVTDRSALYALIEDYSE